VGADKSQSTPDGRYFLLRRLHSLAGIVPVGVFLMMHLTVNSTIVAGGDAFQKQVDRIHDLEPFLVPLEIVGIFLPLLFHAVVGFQIWFSGRPNVGAYSYGANYRYTLQRVTGGIAFVFILYHVWHMHWLGAPLGGARFDPHDAAATAAVGMRDRLLGVPVVVLYAIGVLASVYHLANGIWTSLITWGVTVGEQAQRKSGYVCAALGLALAVAGLSAVRGFQVFKGDAVTVEASGETVEQDAEMTGGAPLQGSLGGR
jgi:succinate dehydrogenase / fumarate reductase cytochrome b subunit